MEQREIYDPVNEYGNYVENHQKADHLTHDHRAQEVRNIAESIFNGPVSDIKKTWPTGNKPDPIKETGYPVWEFRIFVEQVDQVNYEEIQSKILMLKEGASVHFFEFAEEAVYYPKIKSLVVKIRQY